jgi:hypothetical protein
MNRLTGNRWHRIEGTVTGRLLAVVFGEAAYFGLIYLFSGMLN